MDLSTLSGIQAFALRLFDGNEATASTHLKRAIGLADNVFDVEERGEEITAKCRGSSGGDTYDVSLNLDGDHKCSCPAHLKQPVCKHVLAVLLSRLPGRQATQPVDTVAVQREATPAQPVLPAPALVVPLHSAPLIGGRRLPPTLQQVSLYTGTDCSLPGSSIANC